MTHDEMCRTATRHSDGLMRDQRELRYMQGYVDGLCMLAESDEQRIEFEARAAELRVLIHRNELLIRQYTDFRTTL